MLNWSTVWGWTTGCRVTPIKNCSACDMGVTRQPVVQPRLRVHHGQGRLGHAEGWITGNLEERQGAVRPTYVV